jgi:hypothetical protein
LNEECRQVSRSGGLQTAEPNKTAIEIAAPWCSPKRGISFQRENVQFFLNRIHDERGERFQKA